MMSRLSKVVASSSFCTFETQLLHPFHTSTARWLLFESFLGSLAAMLSPKLLLAFLTFLLQADHDVDGTTYMQVWTRFISSWCHCSRSDTGDWLSPCLPVTEERIWSMRQRRRLVSVRSLCQMVDSDAERSRKCVHRRSSW